MRNELIIVTGYFGALIEEEARQIALEEGLPLVSVDSEIEASDGRTVRRIVMMQGEHGYRNEEYTVLQRLEKTGKPCVVSCGDGILYDEDSREIIKRNRVVITGEDMSSDELWENAKKETESYHAFMSLESDEKKREAFDGLIERQRELFDSFKTELQESPAD